MALTRPAHPEDTSGRRMLSRRAVLLGTLQAGVAAVLAGRLIYLQGYAKDRFRDLAENNRVDTELIVPRRGDITDRNGVVIAQSTGGYSVTIVRERARDVDEILRRVALILPLSSERLRAIREEIAEALPFIPVLVADNLTLNQFAKVSINLPNLPGINCEVLYRRVYPNGENYAHVTGYISRVSEEDLKADSSNDPLLHHPNFRIGKAGIEKTMDSQLRGSQGLKTLEVNATGRIVRELGREHATPGKTLKLTIDDGLQRYIAGRMQGQTGVCIALDLANNDILAMVSLPSFDPNKFTIGITHADYQAYVDDPAAPLFNRSTSGTYPPGSTFKMMMGLAALEAGSLKPEDEFFCPGYHELHNQRFHCWNRAGHGRVNLHRAIRESCDVYFYRAAEIVSVAELTAMASRFGYGQPAALPLTALTPGLLPTAAWKQERFNEAWHIGDSLNASIGQGFVTATCLQIATMTARIATGRHVQPRLVHSIDDREQTIVRGSRMPLEPEHLQLIRDSMHAVVNAPSGTAYASRCILPDYLLAGKTGSSQVRRLTEGVEQEDLPRAMRHHALFCGYAPSQEPRYAVSVIVEHGISGSGAAAPVARDILLRLHFGGEPPLDAYPQDIREEKRRIPDDESNLLVPI